MDDLRGITALMASAAETDLMWSRAFASQALSDLGMRELLARSGAAKCHRLHFLQMAAEKLCKAFLIRTNGYAAFRFTHGVVEKSLPLVVLSRLAKEHYSSRVLKARLKAVRVYGHEIDLLSPASDAAGIREDNCEYPWLAGAGIVLVPHRYSFPNLNDETREFIALIKLMESIAETYLA